MVKGQKYAVLQAILPRTEKKPLIATWGGIPLSWDIRATIEDQPSKWRASYSELERRLLAGYCEWCGSTENIEMHHVRAMKDLHEYPGREKPLWGQEDESPQTQDHGPLPYLPHGRPIWTPHETGTYQP